MFQSFTYFLISFKVGFTFRSEPCLIWFWYIISSASNFLGILYYYLFKIICLCGELLLSILLFIWILYCLFQTTPFLLISFLFFTILHFISESQLIFILIYQLKGFLLIFKSNYFNEIFDITYEILIFCKIAKDINLQKSFKLLLTFTLDIFSKKHSSTEGFICFLLIVHNLSLLQAFLSYACTLDI